MPRFVLVLVASVLPSLAFAAAPPPPGLTRPEITGLVFRPDGKILYSAAQDGSVCTHEPGTGRIIDYAQTNTGRIDALAVSPDGKLLATAHGDHLVRIWDADALRVMQTLAGHKDPVSAVAFSPDGKVLASGGYDGLLVLWEVQTGKELRSVNAGDRVTGLAWSPDGATLAAAGAWSNRRLAANLGMADSKNITLWDPQTGRARKELPIRGTSVAYALDGRALVAGGPTVNLAKPGEPARFIINQTAFRVANRIVVYDLVAEAAIAEIEEQGNALAVSGDGRFLATSRGSDRHLAGIPNSIRISVPDAYRSLRLRECCTGQPVVPTLGLEGPFSVVALTPDGTHLALGDTGGNVRVLGVPVEPNLAVLRDRDLLWKELAGEADRAYPAVLAVAARPTTALPLLSDRMRPKPRDPARVRRLIADLDDDAFSVREAASRELSRLGTSAETELRLALSGDLSLEARQRIQRLLAPLQEVPLSPDSLRTIRVILALERAATPEARALLTLLATEGDPLPAREARAALKRLGRYNSH